ncbi:hypothetical protein [Halobaculum sp. MBLA0143]
MTADDLSGDVFTDEVTAEVLEDIGDLEEKLTVGTGRRLTRWRF